jgi:hypothetical protein
VRKAGADLTGGYVKQILAHVHGVIAADCSPELIALKRTLLIRHREHRAIKQLINKLKETANANATGRSR